MNTKIGLDDVKTAKVVQFLNGYLSDLTVLYQKIRSYHWNVEGRNFFSMHKQLEEYYERKAEEIDEVAERILMLGSRPMSTLKECLDAADLSEAPARNFGGEEIGKNLLDDYAYLIGKAREGMRIADGDEDQGTVDMLTDHIRSLEKSIWMLRAFLAG